MILSRYNFERILKCRLNLSGGATGFVGNAIKKHALDSGYEVLSLSRKGSKEALSWKDLQKYGLPPCVAVINVAGENILNPFCRFIPGFKQRVHDSRIQTTKTLAEAIRNLKDLPKVFATISGVGYYPPSETTVYTEESKSGGGNYLSDLCIEWEAAAKLPKELDIRQVQVRSGVVLGKDGGFIEGISGLYGAGFATPIGTGLQWLPWIHIDDLCGIFLHAIENDNVNGVLNGVAPDVIRHKDFTSVYARAMDKSCIIDAPAAATKGQIKFYKLMFGADIASLLLDGQNVIPQQTLDSGYSYKFPTIDKACKDLVS